MPGPTPLYPIGTTHVQGDPNLVGDLNQAFADVNDLDARVTANLTWLDAGLAAGSGPPEGVVTAPVGARYVDKANTRGALEWMKASGTGNTGWVVSVGDTGRRDVKASLINAWSCAFELNIRRRGSVVNMFISGLDGRTATSAQCLPNLPGFEMGSGVGWVTLAPSAFRGAAGLFRQPGGAGYDVPGANGDAGAVFYQTLTWTVDTAWPTTLPGTPA